MKKYICVLFVMLYCFGCKRDSKFDENNRGSIAFTPVLRDKIENFISYADSVLGKKEKEEFYTFFMHKRNDKEILFLGTSFFYKKKRIKGYAFLNGRLVVYYGNSSGQEQDLVNVAKLIQFVDTIPGYRSDACIDMDYQVLKREYVICDKDSLSLIYSGFY